MASLHSLGDKAKLPKTGKPGDVVYHRGTVYLVLANGNLSPLQKLHDVFAQLGIDSIVGPTGEPGKDGSDSTVPGPQGAKGEKGDQGEKGEPGDVSIVGDVELQAAVAKLKAQKAAALAITLEIINRRPESPAIAIAKAHLTRVKNALES